MNYIFKSQRLGFRQWVESDVPIFQEMCTDPKVMEYFPALQSKEESLASISKFKNGIAQHNTGFFAVDLLSEERFIGFIGVIYQTMEAYFTPCYEIGWRLSPTVWNQGLATEGALECLQFVFENLPAQEIYSITPFQNKKSERIMQKIGMVHDGFFDHPKLDKTSPLLNHTIYKVKKEDFLKNKSL